MSWWPYLIIFFIGFSLFSPQNAVACGDSTRTKLNGVIGVILDDTSRVGKEMKVAIEMAVDDYHYYNRNTNQSNIVLEIIKSQGKPWQAALAAKNLIDKHKVRVLMGPHTWGEVSAVAEIGEESQIPILSLADSAPQWAAEQWPFLIQPLPTQYPQMKAVAAILKSRRWNQITMIYENIDSSSGEVIRHLHHSLREVGAEITHTVAISPFSSLTQELERLKRDKYKVFLVHASLPLGIRLFQKAKKMDMMMENGYAWIATNTITDFLHSVNASAITSMQGVLGIKSYFPQMNENKFQDFRKIFRRKFDLEYPDEENNEPGIFAMQAYNATRAVTLALNQSDFKSSLIHLNGLELAPLVYEIVNVIGDSNKVFWSHGKGFSETIDDKATYKFGMRNFGHGRQLSTLSASTLRVGVPSNSLFGQFVNIIYNAQENKTHFTGFSIEVFKATMNSLNMSYDLVAFDGNRSYDELVQQIALEEFDAVAGDVTILASRQQYADFTQPYSESGLEMIVPVQSRMPNKAWLFMNPFTTSMWIVIVAITIYNGFVIWLIERKYLHEELKDSALDQIGTLIYLAFATLFSLHGEKLHSNLSRMAMVVWLFVALIVTQSYTASLASMLTAQRLEPVVKDVQTLKNNNVTVAFCKASFVNNYLVDVLEFKKEKVRNYDTPKDYAVALISGEIGAIFLEVPSAKLFLAQYCRSFIRAGDTFKVGGYGYAFSKGYEGLSRINGALLNISEGGKLKELEDKFITSEKCVDVESGYNENASLSLDSFWVLFVFTGATSTVALALYAIVRMCEPRENGTKTIYGIVGRWKSRGNLRRRFSSKVSHVESPTHQENTTGPWNDESLPRSSSTSDHSIELV